MGNKRKKKKQIAAIKQDDDVGKITALVTEIMEAVKLLEQASKVLVWEYWLDATERLKDLINPPFVRERDLEDKKNHIKKSNSLLIEGGDNDQQTPFENSGQDNLEQLLEELQTNIIVDDNHINGDYINGQRQTLCNPEEEVNARVPVPISGEEKPSELAPISSRRSTRKRQFTVKARELQDQRKVKLKKPTGDETTRKENEPNAMRNEKGLDAMRNEKGPDASETRKTSDPYFKKNDKQVICEIIRVYNNQEPGKDENEVLHAIVSKKNPETTNNQKQTEPVEHEQRATQDAAEPADYDTGNAVGPLATAPTLGDMSYINENRVFLNVENEGDGHVITLGIQEGNVHLEQLQQATQNEVVCADCGQAFLEEKALKAHIRAMHPKEKITSKSTTCGECGKTFCNRSNLKSHIDLCHKGRRDFICDTCGKEFHTKSNLQRHIRSHTGEKPWKCFKCDATFTEKKSMERHTLIHTGLKLYKCEVCGRCLATAWSLKQHQTQHDERVLGSYLCDTCGKTFTLKSNLQSHKKVHLSTRPHPCSLCKRSFYGKGDLDRHMRSHTGEKPYDCQVCNKRFSRLEYLREHLNAHAGIMPYSCPTCGKGFTDRSGYHKHSKRCAIRKPILRAEEDQEEEEEMGEVDVELRGEVHEEEMEGEPIDVTSQEVASIHLDPPTLEVPTDQVGFIDLDPQTNELQVHQIFCTSEETQGAVTSAEHVIDLASSASTYTVLSDDHVVAGSTMADYVCHQSAPLDDGTVETIQNEAHLQWYVQDVVNGEPWQGIG